MESCLEIMCSFWKMVSPTVKPVLKPFLRCIKCTMLFIYQFVTDWDELFTTKCFACGFPVEAGDRWVEALNNNYHSQCFNCTVSV